MLGNGRTFKEIFMNQLVKMEALDLLKAKVDEEMAPLMAIKVIDQDSIELALEKGKHARKFEKAVEDKRVELVKPLNDAVSEVNSFAKKIKGPCENAIVHLKRELANFAAVLEKQRREEADRLAKEKREREDEIERKALAEIERQKQEREAGLKDDRTLRKEEILTEVTYEREQEQLHKQFKSEAKAISQNKVSGERQVWTFSVADLSKVPREYLVLDETKIRKAILAAGGDLKIDGINIFQETKIAFR
jgi:hypothetical protein